MKQTVNIFWFRRDLRSDDNVGLYNALQAEHPVLPIFIFDPEILEQLPEDDARVTFIFDTLQHMRSLFQKDHDSSVGMYYGKPLDVYKQLLENYDLAAVYTNHDYEPYAQKRDNELKDFLSKKDITFKTFKDQVVFEKDEVVKKDGNPYMVYTPYMKVWKEKFKATELNMYDAQANLSNLVKNIELPNLSLSDVGFKRSTQKVADYEVSPTVIQDYEKTRHLA